MTKDKRGHMVLFGGVKIPRLFCHVAIKRQRGRLNFGSVRVVFTREKSLVVLPNASSCWRKTGNVSTVSAHLILGCILTRS